MPKWFDKFIEKLAEIIGKPPYFFVMFVSAVALIVSISVDKHFNQIFAIFIYSIIGSIWRYIEKDLDSGINKMIYKNNGRETKRHPLTHFIIILIYHLGNVCLLVGLFYYLKSVA